MAQQALPEAVCAVGLVLGDELQAASVPAVASNTMPDNMPGRSFNIYIHLLPPHVIARDHLTCITIALSTYRAGITNQ